MSLIFKGIIIGIGKIIPGVSGSVLAIRMGIYENIIYSINNIFDKKNILFLSKVGIGAIIAIIFGSNIISYLLSNYYLVTMIIFLLLILSGIPIIIKEVDNYLISIITCIIYLCLLYIPNINFIKNYFFIGFLEIFTTIVPGISGTALFMSLGLYDEVLTLYSNIYRLEYTKLIPFSLGMIIGTIVIVKFINYCLIKYRSKTYSVILGLLLGSIISMVLTII